VNEVFQQHKLSEGPLGVNRGEKGLLDLFNGHRGVLWDVGGRTVAIEKGG